MGHSPRNAPFTSAAGPKLLATAGASGGATTVEGAVSGKRVEPSDLEDEAEAAGLAIVAAMKLELTGAVVVGGGGGGGGDDVPTRCPDGDVFGVSSIQGILPAPLVEVGWVGSVVLTTTGDSGAPEEVEGVKWGDAADGLGLKGGASGLNWLVGWRARSTCCSPFVLSGMNIDSSSSSTPLSSSVSSTSTSSAFVTSPSRMARAAPT